MFQPIKLTCRLQISYIRDSIIINIYVVIFINFFLPLLLVCSHSWLWFHSSVQLIKLLLLFSPYHHYINDFLKLNQLNVTIFNWIKTIKHIQIIHPILFVSIRNKEFVWHEFQVCLMWSLITHYAKHLIFWGKGNYPQLTYCGDFRLHTFTVLDI